MNLDDFLNDHIVATDLPWLSYLTSIRRLVFFVVVVVVSVVVVVVVVLGGVYQISRQIPAGQVVMHFASQDNALFNFFSQCK
jgi:uncharacterized membrane protein YkvI